MSFSSLYCIKSQYLNNCHSSTQQIVLFAVRSSRPVLRAVYYSHSVSGKSLFADSKQKRRKNIFHNLFIPTSKVWSCWCAAKKLNKSNMYKDFINKITSGLLFTDAKHNNVGDPAKKHSTTESIHSRYSHTEEPER